MPTDELALPPPLLLPNPALTSTNLPERRRGELLRLSTMCCVVRCARRCCEGICALLFSAGIVILIYWAIFQPHYIRAAFDSAALSNLTVVSSNTSSASPPIVSYNLAVNLSFYNPSVRVNIYYDTIAARLRFRDAVLAPAANATAPSEFYQRRKTVDVVKLEFDGRGVGVDGGVAGELEKEARGEVRLELDVDVRVRYVFRIFKLRQKPRITCWLSIPVKAEGRGSGVGGVVGSGDRCSVKY